MGLNTATRLLQYLEDSIIIIIIIIIIIDYHYHDMSVVLGVVWAILPVSHKDPPTRRHRH